jgi:hypothetical protein
VARVLGATLVAAALISALLSSSFANSRAQESQELEIAAPQVQKDQLNIPALDNRLEPVKSGIAVSTPAVDADEALEIAFAEGYRKDGASLVTRTLASFTSGTKAVADGYAEGKAPTTLLYEDDLAWIMTFKGVCVPVIAPPHGQEVPDCAGAEISVVIDAQTGEYIEAYSVR